jgi:voltage-gated potassium channel
LRKIVVWIAYLFDASFTYKSFKHFFRRVLEDRNYKLKIFFDFFMITLVFISVWMLLWEVKNTISPQLEYVEYTILIIFILEYLGRFWVFSDIHKIIIEIDKDAKLFNNKITVLRFFYIVFKDKLKYVTSPLAIIDLLAITPNYRAIRFLRIFRIFRLFKLLRYTISVNEFLKILADKKFEFYTLGIIISFITFISSAVLYIFEANVNPSIENFFDTIYWSIVTISTVGFGDITPKTIEGKVTTIILILTGIGVISFSTSIVISAFNEKIYELKENKIKAKVSMLKEYIIICGFSYIGRVLAQKLQESKKNFLIIDKDEKKIEKAQSLGYLAFCADATSHKVLQESGVGGSASSLISLMGSEVANIYIILTVRNIDKNIQIVSIVNKKQSYNKFKLAGADDIFYPFEMVSTFISQCIKQSIAFDAIYKILDPSNNVMIEAFNVVEKRFFKNKTIGDIDFFQYKLILLGVVRAEFDEKNGYIYRLKSGYLYFNPPKSLKIKDSDVLIFFSHTKGYLYFKNMVRKSR